MIFDGGYSRNLFIDFFIFQSKATIDLDQLRSFKSVIEISIISIIFEIKNQLTNIQPKICRSDFEQNIL